MSLEQDMNTLHERMRFHSNLNLMRRMDEFDRLNSPEALKAAFQRVERDKDDDQGEAWLWTWFLWSKLPASGEYPTADTVAPGMLGFHVRECCRNTAQWGRDHGWI